MIPDKAEEKAREFWIAHVAAIPNQSGIRHLTELLRTHAEAAYRGGQERMRERAVHAIEIQYGSHEAYGLADAADDIRALPIEERKSDE